MSSLLSDNPLGQALAWVSGGLLGLLLLLAVMWVLPPTGSVTEESEEGRGLSNEVPQLKTAEPIENYAAITDRPMFNQSRQPVIGIDEDAEDEEEDIADQETVDAPDVVLAGVVITPELRVATLRLKDSPESLMAFEGQPLEGNFGSWHLSRIEARQVILESGAGEQVRLELQIHDAMMDAPPAPPPAEASQAGQNTAEEGQAMTRADEIRQRIAERREELRRAAEEGGEEAPKQSAPLDYRQAIQQMMKQGQQNQENDESEQ